jgi:hypothetical protein
VHHPTVIAAVAEGRRWRYEGDADVKSKFWGRSIELRPEGGCAAGCASTAAASRRGGGDGQRPAHGGEEPPESHPCAGRSFPPPPPSRDPSPRLSPHAARAPCALPAGLMRLSFADGDVYQWNKVTTSINNLILGKIYIDHGGIMKVWVCVWVGGWVGGCVCVCGGGGAGASGLMRVMFVVVRIAQWVGNGGGGEVVARPRTLSAASQACIGCPGLHAVRPPGCCAPGKRRWPTVASAPALPACRHTTLPFPPRSGALRRHRADGQAAVQGGWAHLRQGPAPGVGGGGLPRWPVLLGVLPAHPQPQP